MEPRPSSREPEQITFGPFRLSPGARLLTEEGRPVGIGGRALDLLLALIERPGRVFSKRELVSRVWPDVVVEESSLRFQMAGLRKALGDGRNGARYIATQVGVGYAFVGQVNNGQIASEARPSLSGDLRAGAPRLSYLSRAEALPPRVRLIGREADIELVLGLLAEPKLLTIVGAGGSGKTALAVETGHRLSREGCEVNFADLSSFADASLVPSAFAGALGILVQTEDPLAALLAQIETRELVLIIDNCEHLVDAVSRIAERIVEAAPRVSILATSREPLRARNEQVHWLGPLQCPADATALTLEELSGFPAVELFLERAAAGNAAFETSVGEARLIAEMCRRLDGLALPIELTAMRAALHGVEATFTDLGKRLSLLWSGRRTAVPRQQTLQATLDWSYDLLPEVEQRTLERLSVFWGPFPVDAARLVVADGGIDTQAAAAAVDNLVAKGLIVPDRSKHPDFYRLLEMTRAFAKEKHSVRGAEDVQDTSRRHAAYYLAGLTQAAPASEEGFERAARWSSQLGNLRSALAWSFGPHGDLEIGVPLAAVSIPLLLSLSLLVECRDWCEQAIARLDDRHRGTASEMELQAALGLTLMFTRGSVDEAEVALRRALAISQALADTWGQLRLLARLQIFFERIGDFRSSMMWAQQAVEVAKDIDRPEAIAVAASLAGVSQHLMGNQALARPELENAMRLSLPSRRSWTLHYGFDYRNRSGIALSRTLWLQGYPDQARQQVEQTISEAAALDHPVTYCIALLGAVSLYLWMEELDQAAATLDEFSRSSELNGLGPNIAALEGLRGALAIKMGHPQEAIASIRTSLARLQSNRYEMLTTTFEMALVEGYLESGRGSEALDLVQRAIERCKNGGDGFALPELLRMQSRIPNPSCGRAGRSEELLLEALASARQQGARAWEVRCASDLARLWIGRGRLSDAFELIAPLHRSPSEGRDTRDMRALDDIWRLVSLAHSQIGAARTTDLA